MLERIGKGFKKSKENQSEMEIILFVSFCLHKKLFYLQRR